MVGASRGDAPSVACAERSSKRVPTRQVYATASARHDHDLPVWPEYRVKHAGAHRQYGYLTEIVRLRDFATSPLSSLTLIRNRYLAEFSTGSHFLKYPFLAGRV